ncbi:NAD(P)-dependent alcohol dehydrogenase [Acinetobacter guillouiae]|uniref:NAD(P)-dependent alcohol dehydrogenase n=1 Tax=Acinetobacter guillouiae TaxID=106649 RepID=A0A8X8KFM5_ACIGI|nr:NAD(P)-dependent alcohol dehydrogenase [Acinetobacter guillouiae]MCF0265211.1 NAD(P)-dependent alcohol dehydrogenase [Acinetobacter guillouiae]
MKIIAAVSYGPSQPFSIQQLDITGPNDEEVLVKIVAAGICHTDLVAHAGVFPIISPAVLGHEGAGVVEKIGKKVSKVKVGDHVAMSFSSCGECNNCKKNQPAYCYFFTSLNFAGIRKDGPILHDSKQNPIGCSFFGQSSFASHAVAHQRNVVSVPKNIPLELIGPLGCGIQTGFGAITRSLACELDSSVLIIGGGTVGLAAVMAAVIQKCKHIILIEPYEARRRLALELGATAVINPHEQDIESEVHKILPDGVNYALDTSGVNIVMEHVFNVLAPKAIYGFVGVPQKIEQKLPGTVMQMVPAGICFKGIIEGDSDPDRSIPELIRYYEKGQLPIDKLIRTYPFEQINEAIAANHLGDCIKPVLLISQ